MNSILLIDFGASRVKTALLRQGELTDIQSRASVFPCNTENGKYETDVFAIKDIFLSLVKSYSANTKLSGIFICSEMHGFALLDNNNAPVSNYVSWKDERCLNEIDGISSFDLLKKNLGNSFFEKTGMNLRPCYPIFNVFHMARSKEISSAKIVSLPEWLCCCGGKSLNVSHCTMSAGLGFYNIYENIFDKDLINSAAKNNINLSFNRPSKEVEAGGYIEIDGKDIPIFTGVGDHQCAVLGAGNDKNSISVNLGTGSQVAIINLANANCEKRPFFNDQLLSVITHIPSGRALNVYVNFLKSINPNIDFWQKLSGVSIEDIKKAALKINLAVFESAWNYDSGGSISAIGENNFNLNDYLASLLKEYAEQYAKAIYNLKPPKNFNKIILSGGIGAKLPAVGKYLNVLTGFPVSITDSAYDETIAGLKIIADNV